MMANQWYGLDMPTVAVRAALVGTWSAGVVTYQNRGDRDDRPLYGGEYEHRACPPAGVVGAAGSAPVGAAVLASGRRRVLFPQIRDRCFPAGARRLAGN